MATRLSLKIGVGAFMVLLLTVPAIAASITGGAGPDALRGTAKADKILGRGGNDRLFGLAGNDVLNGGTGKDLLDGGAGNDRLLARDGTADTLKCGTGRDVATADAKDVARGCEVVLRPAAATPSPQPEPTPPPPPPPPALGTRTNPYPLGTMVPLPDTGGWSMRVNSATPDATAAVMAENMFNDPPASGKQFFMFNLSLSYNGSGSDNLFAISAYLAAVGAANVAYSSGLTDYCGVVPDGLSSSTTVFAGGTVHGNECFSVLATDASSLVLYFAKSGQQTFFALR